jgi:hypothetical protein
MRLRLFNVAVMAAVYTSYLSTPAFAVDTDTDSTKFNLFAATKVPPGGTPSVGTTPGGTPSVGTTPGGTPSGGTTPGTTATTANDPMSAEDIRNC